MKTEHKTEQPRGNSIHPAEQPVGKVDVAVSSLLEQADAFIASIKRDQAIGIDVDATATIAALESVKTDTRSLKDKFLERLHTIVRAAKTAWQERQLAIPDNPAVIAELTAALTSDAQSIEACVALYRRASKQDPSRWTFIVQHLIECAIVPLQTISPTAQQHLDVVETRLRKQQFDEHDRSIMIMLGGDATLDLEYKQHKTVLEHNLFSPTERFLLQQPPEVLDALANFLPDQQINIALAWENQPKLSWCEILTDPEAAIVVDVILSFPAMTEYHPQRDQQAVLAIGRRFSAAQRAAAWEKASKPVGDWYDLYTYLVVANLGHSTTEQIRSLDNEQWQYVKLALLTYGEDRVRELWTDETLLDLKDYTASDRRWGRQTMPGQVMTFVKSLSETVRYHLPSQSSSGFGFDSPSRPGHTVYSNDGFQRFPETIANFEMVLQRVPGQYHDALFAVLKKDDSYYGVYNWNYLTVEQTQHFIQYVEAVQAQDKVQLDLLIAQQEAFVGERWERVQQGIQTCREQGLVIPAVDGYDLRGHLAVYEQAGLPKQAVTNQFWRQCQDQSTNFTGREGYHGEKYVASERSVDSILRLQQFQEFYQKYFSGQVETVAQLLKLSDSERQVIALWPNISTTVDLPVIEGIIVQLAANWRHLPEETLQQLERFITLTPAQQKCWLWLDRNILWVGGNETGAYADLTFALASSDQGEQLEAFLNTTGLTGFLPEATLAMAERPDCIGLFYYLSKEKIEHSQQKPMVDQLIALHDAGLPAEYERTSYMAEGSFSTYSEYSESRSHFLEWDPQRFVELAKQSLAHGIKSLVKLCKLNPTITDEQFTRLVSLAAAKHTTRLQYYCVPEQSEIDLITQRSATAEQLTGLTLDYTAVTHLGYLSEPVWQRLSSNAELLQLFLKGKAGSFPEIGLVLPDEILLQSGVWEYDYPAALWADPEKMQAVVIVQERFADADITVETYNPPWEQWVQTWQQAPWLFTKDSLALFKTRDVRFLLPWSAGLTETEWREISPQVAHYSFEYTNDIIEFIERWRADTLPLTDSQLPELHQLIRVVPWAEAKLISDRLQQGESLAGITTDKDSVKGDYPYAWTKARIDYLRAQVVADLPTFGQDVHDSITFWQEITRLPKPALRNLEQLSSYAYWRLRGYPEHLKQFIAVAEHPNFELAFTLIQKKEDMIPIQLVAELTPAIMEQLLTWPDGLEINLNDEVDFLADPRANAILNFAQELRNIFGKDFRMSVYDLLIMDVEQDLANLRQLQSGCTLPLTPDQLRRLAPVTTGDQQRTIIKLLAMFDSSYKIDFHACVEQLTTLDTDLRVAVILAKGPGNFGWSILPYRQELINALALTSEQVDDLTRACYRNDRNGMPALDTPAALALLNEVNLDTTQKADQLGAVLKKYAGDPAAILDQVYREPAVVTRLAYDQWSTLPDYVKQDARFWELLLTHTPLLFLDHYTERVKTIGFTPTALGKVIEMGGSGQLNTLLDLDQQGEVTLSNEQRALVALHYLEKGGDLKAWLAEDSKRKLLQDQLAANACSWKTTDVERQQLLEQLVKAGLLTDRELRQPQVLKAEQETRLLIAMLSMRAGDLQHLDPDLSVSLGERTKSTQLVEGIVAEEFSRLAVDTVSEVNWLPAVLAFVRTTIEDHQLPQLNPKLKEQVTAAFKDAPAKDLCLAELQKLWKGYLQDGEVERIPIQLAVVTRFVDACDGAGPMTQFEALSLFIHHFRQALTRDTTLDNTRQAVVAGTAQMEQRFVRERWSNEDKSDYYNISRDVLQAAPSLFSTMLKVFQRLSPSEFKRFHEQVYPLVRAELAVLATLDRQTGAASYDEQALVGLRRLLRDTTNLDTLRQQLVSDMTDKFKTRFGIIRIPEQFTTEHVRSLTNSTMYLANMHARTAVKEQLLGWYLALQLNGQWDAYRRGEPINPTDYLTPDKARAVMALFEQRQQLSPITADRLHIPADRLPEFQTILQAETPTIALGDVETIDVRLGNVVANLRTLEDLDLYPDPLDKQRMQVLLEFGSKRVGTVAAKLYRGIELTADEELVCDRMQAAALSPDTIKTVWQDGVKALAVVVNTIRLVEETNAVGEIDTLRTIVQPSAEVVTIFNRLGEEFKVTSGALALTQDLDYLDNIIVKRADELTLSEVTILQEYVGSIRAQVIKLQAVYDQIKTKFGNIRQAQGATPNELLRAKLAQIDAVINTEAVQQTVTTTLTHEWNSIVENIRECLSCTKQGCNNDTDLTFGDSNKFFIYSHTEAQRKGSIADQIVFLEPVSREGGGEELSFVLDRVYGKCTPFILTNHIATVFKKYRTLTARFPDSALSVFVTDAALTTGGLSSDQLATRLQEQFGKTIQVERTEFEVDVVQSATGDHYVEFGGGCRTAGKRKVSGLVLRTTNPHT